MSSPFPPDRQRVLCRSLSNKTAPISRTGSWYARRPKSLWTDSVLKFEKKKASTGRAFNHEIGLPARLQGRPHRRDVPAPGRQQRLSDSVLHQQQVLQHSKEISRINRALQILDKCFALSWGFQHLAGMGQGGGSDFAASDHAGDLLDPLVGRKGLDRSGGPALFDFFGYPEMP